MSDCWQCSGTGKTPAGMDWGGNNIKPTRIKLGPCPVCSGGMVCPWCLYELKTPDGCRCGWKPRRATLAELTGGKDEAVLKREGHWKKETFKVRVTGYNTPPLETKVVTVEAYNHYEAELEAERKSGFDVFDKTEIIGDE